MKCNKYILAAIWAGMFILCAVLGFLPPQEGANRYLLAGFAVLFFLPPGLMVWQAKKKSDRKTLRLVRRISLICLGLTTVTLVGNFLSVLASTELVGTLLHWLLALVSVPMLCSNAWILSLFGWACLLFASGKKRK